MATILILNDEPDLIEACRMVLEADGHSIVATTNPAEAQRLAAAVRPDVVLLDWVMPAANGAEVLAGLRKDPATAGIPVVMMSALVDGAARSRMAGADGFIAKPFDSDQLVTVIASFTPHGRAGAA